MKQPRSTRAKYADRPFFLLNEEVRQRAIAAIGNAPIDPLRPLQMLIREAPKKRGLDQNAMYWAGPLRDISEQAWLEGRQFSAETWSIFFKRLLLPEDFDQELCLESYRKWDIDPAGERVLIGSTTQLTVAGFSQYIEAVTAFGAELGVVFHTKEQQ